MKKFVRILLGILVLLVTAIVVLPYLFKDRLAESVKRQINAQLNAHVDFKDVDLRLLRSFPDVTLEVEGLSVVNKAPFEGDTLFYARAARMEFPLKTIFSSGVDPYTLNYFGVENALVNLITDEEGRTNYDIAKKEAAEEGDPRNEAGPEATTALRLNAYELEQVRLVYEDRTQGLKLILDSLDHRGEGDLSARQTVLRTMTTALLSVGYGEVTYLNRNPVDWKADIAMDLEAMRFNFKNNTAHINRLPLVFEGGIALPEEGVEVDLSFGTPASDFMQFLSLIPEAYSGSLEGVDTGGSFAVKGTVKGVLNEEHIPRFDIAVNADQAHFKYKSMPMGMEEITLKSRMVNSTGLAEETYMTIDTLHFKVAGDPMDVRMKVEALGGHPRVNMNVRGVLNLGNFAALMPAETLDGLQGVLKLDMRSQFDMEAVEKQDYAAIRNKGYLQVSDMKFTTAYLPKQVLVERARMELNNAVMTLSDSRLITGKSDLKLKGRIDDYFQVLSDTGLLRGDLELISDHLELADLIGDSDAEQEGPDGTEDKPSPAASKTKENDPLLPANLELSVSGKAGEVVYDGITLKNAVATLLLADRKLQIRELSANAFGGRIGLGGELNGASSKPEYRMDIKASDFNFADAFGQMDLLKNLMPLARALEGELNSSMHISGLLGDDLSPVLSSLSGSLQGDLKVAEVNTEALGFVQSLNSTFSMLDLTKFSGKTLHGAFAFEEGKVALKPMSFTLNGIEGVLGGTHEFGGKMDYALTLQVPAAYLGEDIAKMAGSLGVKDLDKKTLPVDVLIGGAITSPAFSTNMDKAVADFIAQLTREQKEALVEKGKEELGSLLGKVVASQGAGARDSVAGDSATKGDVLNEAGTKLLNTLFGKKKKKDSTQNN